MIRPILSKLITSVLALSSCSVLAAPILRLEPAQITVPPSGSVSIAVKISGLVDSAAPALGAFDLGVRFDPSVLAFDAATYGDPLLGDQLDLSGFGSSTQTTLPFTVGNLVELGLAELSLDSVDILNTRQTGDFFLAEISFRAVGIGSSPMQLSINSLSDASGSMDSFGNLSVVSSVVTVSPGVPEPGTLSLALLALYIGYLRTTTEYRS